MMSGQLIRWVLAFGGTATLAASLISSALKAPADAPPHVRRSPASVGEVERELILNKIREGDLQWMKKDLPAAKQAWQQAGRMGEGLWPIHEGLGDSYARARMDAEALGEYDTALSLLPETLAALRRAISAKRAETLAALGRPLEALQGYLVLNDPSQFGPRMMDLALGSDHAAALVMIGRHAEAHDPRLFALLSAIYTRLFRPVDAAEALATFAIQVTPWDSALDLRAVERLREAHRLDRALEVCRAWVRALPQALEGYETMGDLLWESGRERDALVAYTSIVDVHPGDAAAHRRLGEIYERRGRPLEALAQFEVGWKAAPNDEALRSKVVAAQLSRLAPLKAEGKWDEVRALRRSLAELKVQEAGIFDVKVVMTWDVMSDVDLDVYEPNGTRINHANRASKIGGAYYMDNTRGLGPETYTVLKAPPGTWRVGAHLHSGAKSVVKFEVILYEDTPQEQRREETLVLDRTGDATTFIRDIVIP